MTPAVRVSQQSMIGKARVDWKFGGMVNAQFKTVITNNVSRATNISSHSKVDTFIRQRFEGLV